MLYQRGGETAFTTGPLALLDQHPADDPASAISPDGSSAPAPGVSPCPRPRCASRRTCTGSIIAVYVGKPLGANELPKKMEIFGGAINADVKFRSNRIAYSVGSMPTPAFGLDPNDGLPGC